MTPFKSVLFFLLADVRKAPPDRLAGNLRTGAGKQHRLEWGHPAVAKISLREQRRFSALEPGRRPAYVLLFHGWRPCLLSHKLPQPPSALGTVLKGSRGIRLSDYSSALAARPDLPPAAKQATAEKLHEYTGLPVAYLIRPTCASAGGAFEKKPAGRSGTDHRRLEYTLLRPSINRSAKRPSTIRKALNLVGLCSSVQQLVRSN